MDYVLLILLILTFSAWLSLHVLLALAVARNLGKAQAALGLLLCPLLPYFGYVSFARKRSLAWVALAVLYGLLLFLASR